jgi:hypothetical protein
MKDYSVAALRDFKHPMKFDLLEPLIGRLHAALEGIEMTQGARADVAAAYLLTILDEVDLYHDLEIVTEKKMKSRHGFSSAEKAIIFFEDLIERTKAA